ncbi:low temperature and salt responsive protein, partial [Musa troglodytarum]
TLRGSTWRWRWNTRHASDCYSPPRFTPLFHTFRFGVTRLLLREKTIVKLHRFHREREREREMGSETFLEVILAILLPPVGVFLRYGCGVEFWIDLLLTILGYIPGIIYAIYVLVG